MTGGLLFADARGAPWLALAGETAQPVSVPDEEPIDQSWAEPEAFDGCSSAGQARPGQAQPIQIVRPANGPSAATGART